MALSLCILRIDFLRGLWYNGNSGPHDPERPAQNQNEKGVAHHSPLYYSTPFRICQHFFQKLFVMYR